MFTLPKSERLRGKTTISALMTKGRWGTTSDFKYCYRSCTDEGTCALPPNRILVSVPKRFFKRAVKRNLLKRRLREAYRTHKNLLKSSGMDVLFLYNTHAILPYSSVCEQVEQILTRISNERQP